MEEAQIVHKERLLVITKTTARQDTQQDKELIKDTRTRQEIQDKALHRASANHAKP
jgi:hypothetical protein